MNILLRLDELDTILRQKGIIPGSFDGLYSSRIYGAFVMYDNRDYIRILFNLDYGKNSRTILRNTIKNIAQTSGFIVVNETYATIDFK